MQCMVNQLNSLRFDYHVWSIHLEEGAYPHIWGVIRDSAKVCLEHLSGDQRQLKTKGLNSLRFANLKEFKTFRLIQKYRANLRHVSYIILYRA